MRQNRFEGTVEALMFDFYGTVVDMQGGLVRAVTPFLEAKGYAGGPNERRDLVAAHPLRELDDRRAARRASTRRTARSATAR